MKLDSKYDELLRARKILELPDEAISMPQIKKHYKRLITKWHPDTCLDKKELCQQMTIKINEAYKIIMAYCNNYKFSFSKEEVEEYISKEEWWLKRFGSDPIWQ